MPKTIFLFRLFLCAILLPLTGSFAMSAKAETAHSFTFNDISGTPFPLSNLKGKALLVVNTASMCGFTKQYTDLQKLWDDYKDKGLVVIGVPSDNFGGQEYSDNGKIKDFCETTFAVDFPLMEKNNVKGKDAHPFYKWARAELGALAAPKWNFHKYLIDPNGQLVDWFSTPTNPTAPKVIKAVNKALAD